MSGKATLATFDILLEAVVGSFRVNKPRIKLIGKVASHGSARPASFGA